MWKFYAALGLICAGSGLIVLIDTMAAHLPTDQILNLMLFVIAAFLLGIFFEVLAILVKRQTK